MSAFSRLPSTTLEALAAALETERVTNGNPLPLQEYVPAETSLDIGREIESLLRSGLAARHIAHVLRAVHVERERSVSIAPTAELVWTGPEGIAAASRDTGVVVRELFASAKKSILLAGFAIHRGREIFRDLAHRMMREVDLEVIMFLNVARNLRDTTTKEQLVARFVQEFRREHWEGTRYPSIFYDPRALAVDPKKRTSLHAKCVVIDGAKALVTSANFTEAAQQRNIEVGALITDATFTRNLTGHFDMLITKGAVERLPL